MPRIRTFLPATLISILLVVPALGAMPAPAPMLPAAAPSVWDHPGFVEMAAELRAAASTPEELADVESVLAWLEENPDELLQAHRLVDEPLPRERGAPGEKAGEEEDGGFSLMRTDNRAKPVLIIHGRDNYNMNGYANLRNYFISAGFSTVWRIGYYGGECNVEHNAAHHGSHANWYGGSGEHSSKTGCNGVAGAQVHDLDTDIMHIAYHFAWMVHDHYGVNGVTVDALGHSMGGLLMRYAIAKSGTGGVWPPKLRVEDATTMGTPHGGLGTSWCKISPWQDVRQMCSDNYFITWMKSNAQNPQGNGGTDWTLMASDCDGWVAWNLAVDMQAAHKVVYVSPCYGHSDYYGDVSTTNNADVDYVDAPSTSWSSWATAPRAGKWSNYALTYGTW